MRPEWWIVPRWLRWWHCRDAPVGRLMTIWLRVLRPEASSLGSSAIRNVSTRMLFPSRLVRSPVCRQ